MTDFLTSDLTRNFGIGFGAGVLALALVNGADWLGALPQMVAAWL